MNGKLTRKSLRLQGFDYSSNGMYFITICTYEKEPFFGNICDGVMHLSLIGKFAEEEIHNANFKRSSDYIEITKFVIMPNHIHMIVQIFNPDIFHNYQKESFSFPSSKSIPATIRSYKSAVTKRIRESFSSTNIFRVWQPRYYDTVIRNEEAYRKICDYIDTNPQRWDEDNFYI